MTPIPRLPVFGRSSMAGPFDPVDAPCVMNLPGCAYTTSGRASILLALERLGVGPGDQVLLPTYHCPTMVAPVVHLGAVPVFYPIDARGAPVQAWLELQDVGRTRAVLVAHFFGLPQPMAGLRQWCDRKGIALIEDCAHAMFGNSDGRSVGAWGDLSIASLTKFLPLPMGGCLVDNRGGVRPPLAAAGAPAALRVVVDVLEVAAFHGRLAGPGRLLLAMFRSVRRLRRRFTRAPDGAEVSAMAQDNEDAAARISGIDAEAAHRALSAPARWLADRLPRQRIVAARRLRYRQLARALDGCPGLRPLLPELPSQCAPYVFPLWVDAPDPGYARLRELGMPVSRWNWLWPGVPVLPGDAGLDWSHHVLQIACHQDLGDDEVERLVATLKQLFGTVGATAARATIRPAMAGSAHSA